MFGRGLFKVSTPTPAPPHKGEGKKEAPPSPLWGGAGVGVPSSSRRSAGHHALPEKTRFGLNWPCAISPIATSRPRAVA